MCSGSGGRIGKLLGVGRAACFRETQRVVRDAREHGVRLLREGEGACAVAADAILLEQVLINLIRNGMEAMADTRRDGAVTVRLFERDGQAVGF